MFIHFIIFVSDKNELEAAQNFLERAAQTNSVSRTHHIEVMTEIRGLKILLFYVIF